MHPAIRASRPLVFAHRGGSKIGPENTIAAFDRGLAAGADGLELDVHLSRDGIVVVHHDAMLDRTTRATGPLKDRTAGELAEFDVPPLRAVLARYPKIGIIIELKERRARARRGGRRRGAPRRRERSRVPGIVQRHRAARGARGRARDCDERRAIRSADGAVSIVVRPLTGPRAVSGVSGSRNQRLARASSRRDSCSSRTKPASPCRYGRSTSRRTFADCSIGAWTASSRTGRTLRRRWSGTGSVGAVAVSRQSTVA